MRTLMVVLFAVAISPQHGRLDAQAPDTSAARAMQFISSARNATERFKDIGVAVAEGYLKIGPDFPAMGEHWVNGELIMRAELNPARPAILTYATIDGKPTLTGAVYALALRPGEKPPEVPASAQWHDHVGSIDEESLLFGHDRQSGSDDLRLVVMHAWLWVSNPFGPFVTDNWALPFARLGLAAPAQLTPAASRAASLLSGAASYYEKLFASVGELDDRERQAMASVLDKHGGALQQWWWKRAAAAPVSETEVEQLHRSWMLLETDLRGVVGTDAARRLVRVFNHH